MSTFKTHPFLYKQKLKVLIYFQVAFVDFQKLDFLLLCYQVEWQLSCILLINSVIFQPLCLKTCPVRGKLFGISKKKGLHKQYLIREERDLYQVILKCTTDMGDISRGIESEKVCI